MATNRSGRSFLAASWYSDKQFAGHVQDACLAHGQTGDVQFFSGFTGL